MALLGRSSAWLYRWSTWRSLLAVTLLYGFFIVSVMPAQSEDSQRYAGDWGAPDRHVFYTPDQLYAALSSWDDAGRRDYIRFRLTLDIVWALAYTGFLIISISCLLRQTGLQHTRLGRLNTLPLLAMLADYTENALGILLVGILPARLDPVAWLAAASTMLKWSALAGAHVLLALALVLALTRALRRRLSGIRSQG